MFYFYCVLCTTVKHFGAVVMDSLHQKCIREGGVFFSCCKGGSAMTCLLVKINVVGSRVYSLLVPYPKKKKKK